LRPFYVLPMAIGVVSSPFCAAAKPFCSDQVFFFFWTITRPFSFFLSASIEGHLFFLGNLGERGRRPGARRMPKCSGCVFCFPPPSNANSSIFPQNPHPGGKMKKGEGNIAPDGNRPRARRESRPPRPPPPPAQPSFPSDEAQKLESSDAWSKRCRQMAPPPKKGGKSQHNWAARNQSPHPSPRACPKAVSRVPAA